MKKLRVSLVAFLLFPAAVSAAQGPAPSRSTAGAISGEDIQYQTQEPQGPILYFPDYVEGGGWSVQLVLSNVGGTTATAVVEAYGQDGQSVSDLFDSGSILEIPSLGSRVLRSSGEGAIRRGWIQVRPDTDLVSGLLTYRHTQTGIEVGVQPIDLGSQFALSVEETSQIGTGLAIFKPEASSEIKVQIRDEEGSDPVGEVLRWGNFQQRARTLPEWFENVDTRFLRDFRGLLFLRSTDGSEFAPLGLRFGKQKGSLSAVPVVPPQEPQGPILYFPDYVEGGGWSVQLVLSNVGASAATAVVEVYGQDGRSVTDLFDSGSMVEIPSLGSRILRSTGGRTIRRGWIEVRSEPGSISGLLTYRQAATGIEVGVQPIAPGRQFALFVEETSQIGTGLAIFKPEASSEIKVQIRDEEGSDPVGEVLRWGNFQQRARTLPEWFENVDTRFLRDFRGLLFLRSTDGSEFAPLGLRFGKQKGSLSAVPVVPLQDAAKVPLQDAAKMYWTAWEDDGGKIQRANLDGSGVEDLVLPSGFSEPAGLALDLGARKMYWTDFETAKIQRANLDGSGVEDLVTSGVSAPSDLALDLGTRKMYWTDMNTDKIQRANLDGSGVEDLVTSGLDTPIDLALDLGARKMYWADTGRIQRANLDGSGVETLLDFLAIFRATGNIRDVSAPNGLALDLGTRKMYWTDAPRRIQRANLDGSEVEDVVTSGLGGLPIDLALDLGARKMYWTVWADTGKIQRANLDGSGVEDLVTLDLSEPYALALDLARAP